MVNIIPVEHQSVDQSNFIWIAPFKQIDAIHSALHMIEKTQDTEKPEEI